ncbi:hypothetical protein SARC_10584 [Sphaeroforma arctica JP610]|uniref:Uncharacterized protein n=1 Tax=Sphaeroforma arctica JP610 TaxID=667725 RepID=A0A0L0FKE1_9EUKA|nr:hypothetical protein SARC_10584 [Sphaeroforma arctica JP610]KNC76941.1 hypothetical protein SARC_10584 [Sphaeroforma arctica JP610]|eukprot:XP_014150843.1 hypothetical protein SARC_10584 [Sphaeroforma arctica JP610]
MDEQIAGIPLGSLVIRRTPGNISKAGHIMDMSPLQLLTTTSGSRHWSFFLPKTMLGTTLAQLDKRLQAPEGSNQSGYLEERNPVAIQRPERIRSDYIGIRFVSSLNPKPRKTRTAYDVVAQDDEPELNQPLKPISSGRSKK